MYVFPGKLFMDSVKSKSNLIKSLKDNGINITHNESISVRKTTLIISTDFKNEKEFTNNWNLNCYKIFGRKVRVRKVSADRLNNVMVIRKNYDEKFKMNRKETSDNFYDETITGQNDEVNEGGGDGCESNLLYEKIKKTE